MEWIGPKEAIRVIKKAQLKKKAEVTVTWVQVPGRRYTLYIDDARTPTLLLDPWRKIMYHGWVPDTLCSMEDLIACGFQEGITHSKESEAFENCVGEEGAVEALLKRFPHFEPSSFTAVDKETGEPIPREQQKYW